MTSGEAGELPFMYVLFFVLCSFPSGNCLHHTDGSLPRVFLLYSLLTRFLKPAISNFYSCPSFLLWHSTSPLQFSWCTLPRARQEELATCMFVRFHFDWPQTPSGTSTSFSTHIGLCQPTDLSYCVGWEGTRSVCALELSWGNFKACSVTRRSQMCWSIQTSELLWTLGDEMKRGVCDWCTTVAWWTLLIRGEVNMVGDPTQQNVAFHFNNLEFCMNLTWLVVGVRREEEVQMNGHTFSAP